MAGATTTEVAEHFGVFPTTIDSWRAKDPEFDAALTIAKDIADNRVERSLYHMTTGFYVLEDEVVKVKTGQHTEATEVVQVRRFIPPDKTAHIFWLKNRRRTEWRDVQQVDANITGRVEHAVDARQAALALLAVLRSAAEDNAKTIEHQAEETQG